MTTNEELFDKKHEGIPKELWKDYHAYRQFTLELMDDARENSEKRIIELNKTIELAQLELDRHNPIEAARYLQEAIDEEKK